MADLYTDSWASRYEWASPAPSTLEPPAPDALYLNSATLERLGRTTAMRFYQERQAGKPVVIEKDVNEYVQILIMPQKLPYDMDAAKAELGAKALFAHGQHLKDILVEGAHEPRLTREIETNKFPWTARVDMHDKNSPAH